jgi:chromosome segregation ATPase
MMASPRWTFLVAMLCVFVAVAGFSPAPVGQRTVSPSNDIMTALLQEVRGLRMAMEHSAAVAPRVQLTLARLNIEEQRIAQLAAQFDRARQEVTTHTLTAQRLSGELEEAEKSLQTTTDEQRRRAIEIGINDLKQQMKLHAASEAAARSRENDAAQALTMEQNRWNDLNARLDELERLLVPLR